MMDSRSPDDEARERPPGADELAARALGIVERYAADAGLAGARILAAGPPSQEWEPSFLRQAFSIAFDIFIPEPGGELEVEVDPSGRVVFYSDPRQIPASAEIHRSEDQVVRAAARTAGLERREVGEESVERVAAGKGFAYRVRFTACRRDGGRPARRVEATVNAATGNVIEFRGIGVPEGPEAAAP